MPENPLAELLVDSALDRTTVRAVLPFQSAERNAAWGSRELFRWMTAPDTWARVLRARTPEATPVAFFVLQFLPRKDVPCAFLANIAVAPEWRRRGVGRRALELIESEARRRGAHRIDLTVHESNLPAQRLYRAMGYRAVEIHRLGYGTEDAYVMVLELGGDVVQM